MRGWASGEVTISVLRTSGVGNLVRVKGQAEICKAKGGAMVYFRRSHRDSTSQSSLGNELLDGEDDLFTRGPLEHAGNVAEVLYAVTKSVSVPNSVTELPDKPTVDDFHESFIWEDGR